MKSWHNGPDSILFDSIKMTALMSFCFGVGLLASSIIGVGAKTQLAETINFVNDSLSTSTASGISGGTSSGVDANITTVTQTNTTTNTSPSTTTVSTSGTGASSGYLFPKLTFTSAVPSVVTSDLAVTINAVAIYRPQLVVRGLNESKLLVLDPISATLPVANFLVRFSQLVPGRYELVAKGYIAANSSMIEVAGPRFEVPTPTSNLSNQTNSSNISTSSTTTSVTPTITTTNNTPTTTNTTSVLGAGSIPTSSIGIADDLALDSTDDIALPKLNLVIPSQLIYKGFVPVQVRTSVSLPEAFIYLQSPNFSTPRFVGKARYYDNSTLLLLIDTNQLPNGEYRIYASAKLLDVYVESEKRPFVIYNSTTSMAVSTTTKSVAVSPVASTTLQPTLMKEPVAEPRPASVEANNTVPISVVASPKILPNESLDDNNSTKFKTTDTSNHSPQTIILTDEMKSLIPLVLKEYEPKINQRLKAFGTELHVEGIDIIKLRKKTEDDLMLILLADNRLRLISNEAKKRLRAEVQRLVYRAEKVELLIKKSDVTAESLDELVKTLKSEASSTEGTLVDTSSPREFGLVREDILQIESVSPIVSVDTVSTSTKVYTEIRGRAVPNSLVTLYIYSTPVMVTVRADADGTFLYVYEKDLEDGDHEVYVALTTTDGEVVVKSPGFQFIREAQAFNSPDSNNGDNLIPTTAGTPLTQNPYFMVLSITLLVISFIFFLLGFKTSRKSDDFTVA